MNITLSLSLFLNLLLSLLFTAFHCFLAVCPFILKIPAVSFGLHER